MENQNTMLRSPGLEIPEDIARLIFQEILIIGDSSAFRTAALISSTFLYVARCHLYRSYTVNLRDPRVLENLDILLQVIRRNPYISTLVKEITITDLWPAERIPRHATILDINSVPSNEKDVVSPNSHPCQPLSEILITNAQNLLPRLLGSFTALTKAAIVCCHSPLDWSALHPSVRCILEASMFGPSSQINTVRFVGIYNIPGVRSSSLLKCAELEFDGCQFAFSEHPSISHHENTSAPRPKAFLEYLNVAGQSSAGYARALASWKASSITVPRARRLRLAIQGWGAIPDIGVLLHQFGPSAEEMTFSMENLELRYLQFQPPLNPLTSPHTYHLRLPRIHPHGKGDCLSTGDLEDALSLALARQLHTYHPHPHVTDTPGWFTSLMSPLRPASHPPLNSLRKLNFEISHWRSARDVQANGELFWVINYLAELPFSGAQGVRELTITVDVGTDFCLDNPEAMTELLEYQGWIILDLALTHPSWAGLESVSITSRSHTSCSCGAEEQSRLIMEWLKAWKLPRLNACRILNVRYIPLRA
ncbi:hypothetical protein CPB83DRAFT_918070 [Crepidotus variabilis]|uniref:Uncharacterized protein n=1 Tax=Crepidotus variabilis TaxID=179855 RepID=A0A9P6E4N8_9AGAR|nr:hypothetical protein CPB83DRAFT_918070 [Crepidotus variabilis]